MSRDRQALTDIIMAIKQIARYSQNLERKSLQNDDEKQAAILYRLVVIGEATKRLSTEFRDRHSIIPWREMAGLRDVVVHDYDELDYEILWNVVRINLPEISPQLQAILDRSQS